MRKYLQMVFVVFFAVTGLSCSQASAQEADIAALRDSLDAVQYTIPQKPPIRGTWTVINVRTQSDWDKIKETLKASLVAGNENILVKITGKNIEFRREKNEIVNWKFPKANIRIEGCCGKMVPYGHTFKRCDKQALKEGGFYSFPFSEFGLDDVAVDSKGDEVPFREEVCLVQGDVLKVNGSSDIWKFQIDLPDLSEEQCKDFYVLMTRDWTSARHKVVMVKDGWLYYHLDSEDLHSDRDPNVDWKQYKVRPRYRLINNPVSKGLHTANGRIYIPKNYKRVRVNRGGQLITFAYCHFNSLEITGFELNGCGGGTPIGVYSSTFENGAFIHDNSFSNMSSTAISTAYSKNVTISNNTITKTRVQALAGGGTNCTINGNHLKNIGWMLNTRAITGGGERMLICDNVIEDFNYGAIAVGSATPNDKAKSLTYIIERNLIRLTKDFTDNYIQNTLADGGGIYIGPQCTQGIIRNNVVENIKGIHSNRGIFLDDGAKNLAIYGNLIINTANSYDIDLRLTNSKAQGIPDHNTNNSIFQNIMTGGYRFQDKGVDSKCFGGENVLLGTGPSQKMVVELQNYIDDVVRNDISLETVIEVLSTDSFVKKQLKNKKLIR
ncbi:MAG: right-handed parallel beta-helix repeat-containing protein [Bacteroidaceae bacterium]|nr:right-handed parallel beta-helix repeat-containing protein [Bacteroidaceae bacterium]